MNQKLKAGLITTGFATWCAAVAVGLQFASKYITVEQFSMGLAVVGISVCFFGIYSLILSKLEFDAKITELVDRK
jgi:intracellular septation protein A